MVVQNHSRFSSWCTVFVAPCWDNKKRHMSLHSNSSKEMWWCSITESAPPSMKLFPSRVKCTHKEQKGQVNTGFSKLLESGRCRVRLESWM